MIYIISTELYCLGQTPEVPTHLKEFPPIPSKRNVQDCLSISAAPSEAAHLARIDPPVVHDSLSEWLPLLLIRS